MENGALEKFYSTWSTKSEADVTYDIEAAMRKADVIVSDLPREFVERLYSVLDFGCGYGAFLTRFKQKAGVEMGFGVDFSGSAIHIAQEKYQHESLKFYKLASLDLAENLAYLNSIVPQGVDCVLLIDLLEHVPDCRALVDGLSKFTKYFVIKLPVESSLMDNYFLTKEYPSPLHSNGHLREFDPNNVHYFIRQLGLTPIYETLYVYHIDDAFPPCPENAPLKQRIVRKGLKIFKHMASWFLPRKIFMKLVGGGGYFCIATFDHAHVLNP